MCVCVKTEIRAYLHFFSMKKNLFKVKTEPRELTTQKKQINNSSVLCECSGQNLMKKKFY